MKRNYRYIVNGCLQSHIWHIYVCATYKSIWFGVYVHLFTVQLPGALYSFVSHTNCQIMIAQVNVMLHAQQWSKRNHSDPRKQTNKQANKHVSWWFEFKEKKLNFYVFIIYKEMPKVESAQTHTLDWYSLSSEVNWYKKEEEKERARMNPFPCICQL